MTRTTFRLWTCCLLALTACASAPDAPGNGVAAPEMELETKTRDEMDAQRREFHRTLLRIDQALESYVGALSHRGDRLADEKVEKLDKLLRNLVLDDGSEGYQAGKPIWDRKPGQNYALLKRQAAEGDPREIGQRGIALTALGFAGRDDDDVLQLLTNGAMSDNPAIVDRSVLGFAILRSPKTPIGLLASIAENASHPTEGRAQAAWALHEVQSRIRDQDKVAAIWQRFLNRSDELPDSVLVQAVRGLGVTMDEQYAKAVVPMLHHPVPRIRMAAAVALGRMNAQDHWEDLLTLLEPGETVQNVRLHARKALMALAGNKDYGYDIQTWRSHFDRGR